MELFGNSVQKYSCSITIYLDMFFVFRQSFQSWQSLLHLFLLGLKCFGYICWDASCQWKKHVNLWSDKCPSKSALRVSAELTFLDSCACIPQPLRHFHSPKIGVNISQAHSVCTQGAQSIIVVLGSPPTLYGLPNSFYSIFVFHFNCVKSQLAVLYKLWLWIIHDVK